MTNASARRIRVLVVDDSAAVRQTLTDILSADPDITVIGTACDPYAAVRKLRDNVPDVITLDIEMPRMDGITFLNKLMQQHPIPVVICSSLARSDSDIMLHALEAGAVEVITKPAVGTRQFLLESRIRVCDAVKAAAQAKLVRPAAAVSPPLTAPPAPPWCTTDKVICIGASTGGTEALRVVLQGLPADSPGVLVVQHMPEHFTTAFARRLDSLCAVGVREAQDGDPVLRGQVLVAPGDRHMLLKRSGARYQVEVRHGPLVTRHRPSVDVLFRSAAHTAGANAIGVIMTGMGDDGSRGLREMKQMGAVTLAQDEATSVVFGMPNEAIKAGAVDHVVPLPLIAVEILRIYRQMTAAPPGFRQ